jgi:RNA polymerase sigma factor (TIGR02999 family)
MQNCARHHKERISGRAEITRHGGCLAEGLETRFAAGYAEILKLARARLAREQAPISTGTLAHELYLNLRDRPELQFANVGQFMAYASRAMRSLLVDMARERLALKRDAKLMPLTLGADVPDMGGTPEQLVALDDALTRLGNLDERLMRVGEMRIIMGMEVPEIAAALTISEPTVKRDWQRAKAYLHEVLGVGA